MRKNQWNEARKHSLLLWQFTLIIIACSLVIIDNNSALAAEKIVLKYKSFRQSVSVKELTTFAETGEVSPTLNFYLERARQDPQTIRNTLTKQVTASPVVLDRTLNSRVGEFLLDRISQSIHTDFNLANRQALRSALVLSASKDNKVSLIEIIQNYPTQEVYVEGDRLAQTYNQFSILVEGLQNLLATPASIN